MRKEFQENFRRIAKAPPVVVAEIYRMLTSDATAIPNPALTHRLRQFLESDYDYLTDESVLVDLRRLNQGQGSKFDNTWNKYCKSIVKLLQMTEDMAMHTCQLLCPFLI